jgi:glyoxylase-like metal-dependent hydrolase (beta-lactamase superfamily II)
VTLSVATVGPFEENSYLVVDDVAGVAALVDPGDEPERLVELVRASGATLEAIWLTHAHIDHIGGIAGVKRVWDVPVYLHPADLPLYERGSIQAAIYGIPFEQPGPPDQALADGDQLRLGSLGFEVFHTPGHAPGHVVLYGHGLLLGGDLLFAGSIGRTDLPFCDPAAMEQSLLRVCDLGNEVVVHPGHGPSTTIGAERATNPLLPVGARRPMPWVSL